LPGVGLAMEKKIWMQGVTTWERGIVELKKIDFVERNRMLWNELENSMRHLNDLNYNYFSGSVPKALQWRVFPEFRNHIAYLDIETTGLSSFYNEITTISVYDGSSIFCFVNGQNLDEFINVIKNYKVIVTYNGKTFDVPFIENFFNIKLDQLHIDLRYVLKSLGLSGGLKGCEKKLGISRNELEGVDGYFAVLLWNEYRKNKNIKALETLLAYNIEDVVNLELLLTHAYNMNLKDTPFLDSHKIQLPQRIFDIPFKPDTGLIEKMKRDYYSSYHF
jgi:uncharacterized protein YprB with RNaseH-like and TPR domain